MDIVRGVERDLFCIKSGIYIYLSDYLFF
jgi:hypothetical protein